VDSPAAAALAGSAVSRVATFGTAHNANWQARDVAATPAGTRFHVFRDGTPFGTFELPLIGAHNVRNALAAIAVGSEVGIAPNRIADALRLFTGVKRRLEIVGIADGVTVYDDFAHHPTAVAETLAGLRASNPEARIWAVFEPRSASSCRRVFQDDFARAFQAADEVIVAPVFRSTLPEPERLSVADLVRDVRALGPRARAVGSLQGIIDALVAEHLAGDLVVMMSNGGFGGVHRKVLQALDEARLSHPAVG
jgi:UDP-N-acetylmuramate: L-alanyl-gamma-D-glutamyl-meso-diaminopimelate ligase